MRNMLPEPGTTKEGTGRVFVLTGATGFLGSHLMAALAQRGDRLVVLGRPERGNSLRERIKRLLAWFDIPDRSPQVETVETDLLKPSLGLDTDQYDELRLLTGRSQIIHCASDTSFSERNRPQSTSSNVHSLEGMINFAEDSGASFFHYVSTAYVAPRTSSLCTETPVNGNDFANVYEETKAQAERIVAARCGKKSVPFTILRPSVVYGDSRSGRANRFNALYYHVKSLYYIRDIYIKDILKQGGRKSREWNIYLDDRGTLHLPLRIFLAKRGYVNLIPVDYFVSAVLSILEKAAPGAVYHITSDRPRTTEELASYCELFLGMRGIEVVYGSFPEGRPSNPAEALFNSFIKPYRPYLSDTRVFDRSNTNRASAGLNPPELTYDVFHRCMDYAVSVNWERERA